MQGAQRRKLQVDAQKAQALRASKEESEEKDNDRDPPALQRALALHTLWRYLVDEEDVAAALRRLCGVVGAPKGGRGFRKQRQQSLEAQGGGMMQEDSHSSAKQPPRDLTVFNKVTEAADLLLRKSMTSVYTLTKRKAGLEISEALADAGLSRAQFESLLVARGLQQQQQSPPPAAALAAPPARLLPLGVSYEFMWQGDSSGTVHGPQSAENMNVWLGAGYFSVQRALYRVAGGEGSWEPLDAK